MYFFWCSTQDAQMEAAKDALQNCKYDQLEFQKLQINRVLSVARL